MRTLSLVVISWLAVTSVVGCASGGRAGRGQQFDDAVITANVKQALRDEPSLDAREIIVETSNGTVQLSGFVDDREDAKKAAEVARAIAGVRTVMNDLLVR
jgi:osmotically-inducible protein OsmY